MHAVQTRELELMSARHAGDPDNVVAAAWPVHRGTGARSTAAVLFELAPGKRLGTHTDSAEEVLVVLEGEIEAVIGWERARVRAGGVAVVPAMVPHEAACVGDRPAKVLGVFPSNTIVSVFEETFDQTGGRVVGTPPAPEAVPEPVAGA